MAFVLAGCFRPLARPNTVLSVLLYFKTSHVEVDGYGFLEGQYMEKLRLDRRTGSLGKEEDLDGTKDDDESNAQTY